MSPKWIQVESTRGQCVFFYFSRMYEGTVQKLVAGQLVQLVLTLWAQLQTRNLRDCTDPDLFMSGKLPDIQMSGKVCFVRYFDHMVVLELIGF